MTPRVQTNIRGVGPFEVRRFDTVQSIIWRAQSRPTTRGGGGEGGGRGGGLGPAFLYGLHLHLRRQAFGGSVLRRILAVTSPRLKVTAYASPSARYEPVKDPWATRSRWQPATGYFVNLLTQPEEETVLRLAGGAAPLALSIVPWKARRRSSKSPPSTRCWPPGLPGAQQLAATKRSWQIRRSIVARPSEVRADAKSCPKRPAPAGLPISSWMNRTATSLQISSPPGRSLRMGQDRPRCTQRVLRPYRSITRCAAAASRGGWGVSPSSSNCQNLANPCSPSPPPPRSLPRSVYPENYGRLQTLSGSRSTLRCCANDPAKLPARQDATIFRDLLRSDTQVDNHQ